MKAKKLKNWIVPICCGLAVILVFQFVLMIGYVPSESMEPTISQGSYILGLRVYGGLLRGDIVIFEKDHTVVVKRIAGVPGDHVYSYDGLKTISVNDPFEASVRIVTVPEGHYFVMGDNPEHSFDSRYWEDPFISETQIRARLFIR